MRTIFEQSPIAERLSPRRYPGPACSSDDELVDSALDGGYCGYHADREPAPWVPMTTPSSTVGCGSGEWTGLRVVDCSVMPTMVAGNLNGPIMAMAWRAADFILEEQ